MPTFAPTRWRRLPVRLSGARTARRTAASCREPDTTSYVAGFLATTAGLHIAGAAGGLLLLECANGRTWLRAAGAATAAAGLIFAHVAIGGPDSLSTAATPARRLPEMGRRIRPSPRLLTP